MAEQKRPFLSSQVTEVNKNSISYTSFVSPRKKKKGGGGGGGGGKEERKENKERVWGQTKETHELFCLKRLLTTK